MAWGIVFISSTFQDPFLLHFRMFPEPVREAWQVILLFVDLGGKQAGEEGWGLCVKAENQMLLDDIL